MKAKKLPKRGELFYLMNQHVVNDMENKSTVSPRVQLITRNTTPRKTALEMERVINEHSKEPYLKELAAKLLAISPTKKILLQNLLNFAYNAAYYEADTPEAQVIKTPRAVLRTKRANCVDYTVLIASLAKAIGLPTTIKVVEVEGQEGFGHVYPVINGTALDTVPFQAQDGNEYRTRKPGTVIFPKEVGYTRYFVIHC